MTQEDRQLLLKDLCARLPYGVIVNISHIYHSELKAYIKAINPEREIIYYEICGSSSPLFERNILGIKPYLRPMSSMTEEEKHIIFELFNDKYVFVTNDGVNADNQFTPIWKPFGLQGISFKTMSKIINWLNKNMFDYLGLISKGLAIEVTKENNPYEKINL